MIGSWGPYIFDVSDSYILTLSEGTFATEGRWATHETQGSKPQSEFLGPGLSTFSAEIILRADYGVSPAALLRRIRADVQNGSHYPFIIGGRPLGNGTWKCLSASEAWDTVYNGGEIFSAKVSISLEEYE